MDFLQKDFGIKHDADSPEIIVCDVNFRQVAKKSRANFESFMAGFIFSSHLSFSPNSVPIQVCISQNTAVITKGSGNECISELGKGYFFRTA